tara:strand:+ start:61 stop:579 length:519 start_codon:yes stop_codon:yes gene_type:complete
MTTIISETKRLVLRRFENTDVDELTEVLEHPEVMEFSPSGPIDRTTVAKTIQKFEVHWKTWGFGQCAVAHKKDQKVIGYCGLTRFSNIDGEAEDEIGYRLNRNYWGQGYATEAAQAIQTYGFTVVGLKRMVSMIDHNNVRSIRVAEKIGLHYEKDAVIDGYVDQIYVIEQQD